VRGWAGGHRSSRLFLERREDELTLLLVQFSSTNVMDEKTELVVQFLNRLWAALEQEPMLAATSEEQGQEARKAVERAIFSQVPRGPGPRPNPLPRSTWRRCTRTRRRTCRGTWCCSSTSGGWRRW
jgi:hypothetical protein